ncbi:MAG TPA: tetratricopeptide repeat protein, partial [Anaerolineae bacterium]|nr:tetratricopeptide repeat protein [Anaerolineae bacterium]
LDRPADAIAAYQQALTRAPADLQLYVSLHDLYQHGRFDAEAQGVRDQVLRRFQDDHDRLIEFGQALMDRRQPPAEAIRFYQRAVELQPKNVGTRLQIGALYFDRGDATTAREHFAEAVKLTEAKSTTGQQARQALARTQAARRAGEAGGNDRIRQMAGPLLISIMAALANAQLSPLHISPISWVALIGSGVGAYRWATAESAESEDATQRTHLPGLIGAGVWLIGFGLIVIKV